MNTTYIRFVVLLFAVLWMGKGYGQDPISGGGPGASTLYYKDGDGDGYGDPNRTRAATSRPVGYVTNNRDLDDGNQWITNIAPRYFYRDKDGDTFGNPAVRLYRSARPTGYVTNNKDCDDDKGWVRPNLVWYQDYDRDGYGNKNIVKRQCYRPSGYVDNHTDLNDRAALITNIPPKYYYKDGDGDGFGLENIRIYSSEQPTGYADKSGDCDDGDVARHPNTVWYRDGDGDDWGSNDVPIEINEPPTLIQCEQPIGYVIRLGDCNDDDINVHPNTVWYKDHDDDGFAERTVTQCFYPGIDFTYEVLPLGDCDDDDKLLNPDTVWYKDKDGDGFAELTKVQCAYPGEGYTRTILQLGDCNDGDKRVHPNTVWYKDKDGDGFAELIKTQCEDPGAHYSIREIPLGDCDDDDDQIHPNTVWYADGDNDGFGDPNVTKKQCSAPTGYVLNSSDVCPGEFGELQGCIYSPENFVFTRTYQQAMLSESALSNEDQVIEGITFYDGLGRPKQQVAIRASADAKDIVTHMAYDEYGRQAKEYLPFRRDHIPSGGYSIVDIERDINSYYQNKYSDDFTGMSLSEVNAYSEKIYEHSPLNRVLEQGAPGKAWQAKPDQNNDHTIKFDWKANTAAEGIVCFTVGFPTTTDTEAPILEHSRVYGAGELMVTITKDENWQAGQTHPYDHTTREYTDKLGRVVLKRTYSKNIPHDTYYVHDDYGNLAFVIPPKVNTTDGVSQSELDELCYQYKYDYRNRLIEKKIPGKGWEYIVYNRLDQPILTQDALLKAQDAWLYTKYDAFGRVAYTGKLTDSRDRKTIQDEATAYTNQLWVTKTTTGIRYDDGGYPKVTSGETLTINYYDGYGFDVAVLTAPTTVYGQAVTDRTKSLATGSKVKVLGTDKWITTVTYYDAKARPIYVASKNNYLNTTDIVESKLDFVGKVLETRTTHTKGSNAPIVTVDTFTYDHMGRLLTQSQTINNGTTEQIVSNTYDALGQLVTKQVGGGLQEVDYTYNVRGWLQKINSDSKNDNDLFDFSIAYNNPVHGATALFNGNISETSWQTANDNVQRHYRYGYDALNRITAATSNDNRYNLSGVTYDQMGNILSLQRTGHLNDAATNFGAMDILSYQYDAGNKLRGVTDTGNKAFGFKDGSNTNDDFEYDANGNMILDRNKGITAITYNHLNLPETVSISNAQGTGNISYIYDATGAKQKKIVTEGSSLTNTEYAGGYVYKNDALEFFNHPEGIVEKEADGYKYVYQFKDHLDNIRLSYKDVNKDGMISQSEIIEESNYYPFGLEHKGYNNIIVGREHHYKYNGVEHEKSLGLNLYEMDWRQYDSSIGRFTSIDPYSTNFSDLTTYHYSYNSPILFNDPDGLFPENFASTVVNDQGMIIDHKDDGDTNIYLNSRAGQVVGEEEEGEDYKVGDQLFVVDNKVDTFFELALETNKVKEETDIVNQADKRVEDQLSKLLDLVNSGVKLNNDEVEYLANLLAERDKLSQASLILQHKKRKLKQLFDAYQNEIPWGEAVLNGTNSAINFIVNLFKLGDFESIIEKPDGSGETFSSEKKKGLKKSLGLRPADARRTHQKLPYTLDYYDY